jgi:hypothetical protein
MVDFSAPRRPEQNQKGARVGLEAHAVDGGRVAPQLEANSGLRRYSRNLLGG